MSGWEVHKESGQEATPAAPTLATAAKHNDVRELGRLLGAGAELEVRDARGYSPLMLAAYCGNIEAFDYLLARGADPNSRDLAGNTVLMGAAFKGHTYIVTELLEAGADPTLRNHAGLDALEVATTFGRHEMVALVKRFVAARGPQPRA